MLTTKRQKFMAETTRRPLAFAVHVAFIGVALL